MSDKEPKGFEGKIKHGEDEKTCPVLLAAHLSNGGRPMTGGKTNCLGAKCEWFIEWPEASGCVIEALTLALLNLLAKGN